ncbi:hypothetical protein [Zooshikella ganghwensis]|uniref:Uncharacterized protein n=1 Tax=Zooshikella ganghwensis TaxID=202772 RepID=A0A4P9VKE0_9GAMM|nr:hypothetical protein [Zooshikella ganghwensis]RDH42814.1 hypothetical protein B9G39_04760 [Zooshikella ganghwensis]
MTYTIPDEPTPSTLAKLAVRPMWPLFALMFVNTGVSWLWFIANSFFQGSPYLKKEVAWIALGLAGSCLGVFAIATALSQGFIDESMIPYLLIILTVWKLGISYKIFVLQNNSFELFEYFQESVSNGAIPFIAMVIIFQQISLYQLLPSYIYLVLR